MLGKIKNKFNEKVAVATASLAAIASSIGIGVCDVDANSSLKSFLSLLFNLMLFGGIILSAAGIVSLIRTIMSMTSGEQAQPGALGRGIGLLLGGIVLMAAKGLLKLIGIDVDGMSFV